MIDRTPHTVMQAAQQHILFQTYLMRSKEEVLNNLKKKIFPSTEYQDYDFIKTLGRGSYGHVVAAQNIHNKKIFAVKIISKKNLVKEEHLRHLISEIRILNSVNFEFLISLEYYFTNTCYVFIVLPYINGGHFSKLLRKVKKLDENAARFFAGQVVLAIEYLHYMGIVYRDLKPENLLLDIQGYLKLVDYGFAKRIGHSYSYTFCGTPEYIAPEVLLSKGYSLSPDWWTLGILLYEMCNGSPPFTSKNMLRLYEKILVGEIVWPADFSFELKSIVQGLLQVDKTQRLGCMKKKAEDVKFHKWFSSLDWTALWKKKILPPIAYTIAEHNDDTDPINKMKFSFSKCKSYIPSDMIRNIDFAI